MKIGSTTLNISIPTIVALFFVVLGISSAPCEPNVIMDEWKVSTNIGRIPGPTFPGPDGRPILGYHSSYTFQGLSNGVVVRCGTFESIDGQNPPAIAASLMGTATDKVKFVGRCGQGNPQHTGDNVPGRKNYHPYNQNDCQGVQLSCVDIFVPKNIPRPVILN